MLLLHFSIAVVENLRKTLNLLGLQLKKCLKEYFSLAKTIVNYVKEKTGTVREHLIALLRALKPIVEYAVKMIENLGLKMKKYVDHFVEKYLSSVLGNFGNSSTIFSEFLATVKDDIENFIKETKLCFENHKLFKDIGTFYHDYFSWLDVFHFQEKIVNLHQQISR